MSRARQKNIRSSDEMLPKASEYFRQKACDEREGSQRHPGAKIIHVKLFSVLRTAERKISLLINMKMPPTVGIFIIISREIYPLSYSYLLAEIFLRPAMFSKVDFAIVSNLRCISRTKF